MEIVPAIFKMERNSMLPILTVTGMCNNSHMADRMLISKAIQIIELAQNQLKGKLMELMGHENDIVLKEGMIAIRFYIIFKNDEEFDQAIARLQKGLG